MPDKKDPLSIAQKNKDRYDYYKSQMAGTYNYYTEVAGIFSIYRKSDSFLLHRFRTNDFSSTLGTHGACEYCGKQMEPCPARADGELTFVGYKPCPCIHPIMTDNGVVYPGEEDHTILIESGTYSVNNLLTPIKSIYGKCD